MAERHGFSGAVLAGGASRRMGRDKPFVVTGSGRTLLQRALDALAAAGVADRWVIVGDVRSYAAAAARAGASLPAVHLARDAVAGRGPVGGLEAALRFAARPWTVVVACDMPCLSPALLGDLLDRTGEGIDAVVPVVEGRAQPLHAVYHRRCLPAIQGALRRGELGLTRLLDALSVRRVAAAPGPSFCNVNTPDDLDRLQEAP